MLLYYKSGERPTSNIFQANLSSMLCSVYVPNSSSVINEMISQQICLTLFQCFESLLKSASCLLIRKTRIHRWYVDQDKTSALSTDTRSLVKINALSYHISRQIFSCHDILISVLFFIPPWGRLHHCQSSNAIISDFSLQQDFNFRDLNSLF